jgi:hypothetical protein
MIFMETRTTIILLVMANAPIYFLFGWLVFGTWSKFVEALWYVFCAAGYQFDYGEESQRRLLALVKVLWFLISAAAVVGLEYALATRVLAG